jgi:hypothetical protein
LNWIVELLTSLAIPFQAVGGLAARAYGARRPLADLDFYVPTSRLSEVAVAARGYLTKAPGPHDDAYWSLHFAAFAYAGVRIELGGADNARFMNRRTTQWNSASVDFGRSVERSVWGVRIPVMPQGQLVTYKRALDRDVDRQDLVEMEDHRPEWSR